MCSEEGHGSRHGSTLHSLVSGRADTVAVRYDDGQTVLQVTYGELARRGAQVHDRLLGLLRRGPNRVVGLFTNPVLHLPACILGILQVGAAYVPLDPLGPSLLAVHVMRMTIMQLAYIQVTLIQAFRIQFQEWLDVFCIDGEKCTEDDSESLGLSLRLVRIQWKENLPTTHVKDIKLGDTMQHYDHSEGRSQKGKRTLCHENSGRQLGTDCSDQDSAESGKVCLEQDGSILGLEQPSVVMEGPDEDGKEASWRPDYGKDVEVIGSDAIAYVLHTSGTTGSPKIVHVPHACIVPNITHLRSLFAMSPEDQVVLVSALTFDPSVVELFVALASGATLLMVPPHVRRSPRELQRVLFERSRATVLQATPTLLRRFGTAALRDVVLAGESPLRILALGGEPFPPLCTLLSWKSVGNRTRLFNLYGITEVSCWATCHEVVTQHLLPGCEQNPVPVGEPLLGTRVEVRDGAGQVLLDGEGQIYIGGESRTCLLNAEVKLVPDTMRPTGDVGRVAGGRIYYAGRSDGRVKRHGQQLDPMLLQETAERLAAVEACAAVLTPGQTLLLFVVPVAAPGSRSKSQQDGSGVHAILPPLPQETATHEFMGERGSERPGELERDERELDVLRGDIVRELASLLPSHARPDSVTLIPALPLTAHGKVAPTELLALYEVENAQITSCRKSWEPEQLTRTLWACWQEALGRAVSAEPTDLAAAFLRVGGDSLAVVRLSGDVERRLGATLPGLPDLLLHRTFGLALCYCARELRRLGRLLLGDGRTAMWDCDTDEGLLECNNSGSDTGIADNTGHSTNINSENSGNRPRKILKRKIEEDIPEQETSEGKSMVVPSENINRRIGRPVNHQQRQRPACELTGDGMVTLSRGSRVVHVAGGRVCNVGAGWQRCGGSTSNEVAGMKTGGMALRELWKCDTGKCVDASPLLMLRVCGTAVCVGSHSCRVLCAAWPGGRVLWTVELPDRVESSACLSQCGTLIALGCYDGCVYVLRVESGAMAWAFRTGGPVKSSPVLDPLTGALLVGSHDQLLYALHPKDETCVWRLHCGGGSVFSSPCVNLSPRAVYVGTLGGRLLAVNPDNGSVLWSYDCGKPLFSSPACSCAFVCIGSVDGSLYTFNHAGDKLWQFQTDGPIFSSPCIVGNLGVVFGSHDGNVYAISASGELRWRHQLGAPVYATPCTWVCIEHDLLAAQPSRNQVTCDSDSEAIISTHNRITGGDRVLKSSNADTSPTSLDFQKYAEGAHTTSTTWQCGITLDHSLSLVQGSADKFTLDRAPAHHTGNKDTMHRPLQNNTDAYICSFVGQKLPLSSNVSPGASVGHSDSTRMRFKVCPARFVVAAGTDGLVCVLDEQGILVCSYRLPGEVFSSPVAWGDCLLIGCRDDYLYCLEIYSHPTKELKS